MYGCVSNCWSVFAQILDASLHLVVNVNLLEVNMMFVLLSVIVVSNIPNSVTLQTGDCNQIVSIHPVDPYFLETEDIVIECFTKRNADHLTFFLGKDNHSVDEKFIQKRNGTFVKLVIPGITETDVKDYKAGKNVFCKDVTDGTCFDNEYIMLEYYPITPENITCQVFNFKTLLCTWDLGVQYKFPEHMSITCQFVFNVSTKYKIYPRVNGWANCPNGTNTHCFWDSDNYHNSKQIVLNVSVQNLKRNITLSENVTFYRDDILKPGKVEKLNVTSTEEPTCVDLTWVPPALYRNFTYNITYQSECESTEKWVELRCGGVECFYNLCGLNPFTMYTFKIVSRYSPYWVKTGYQSDPTVIGFLTDRTIPEKSPLVTDGLYLYGPQHLILYWQPLGKCDQYSDDTEYEVSFDGTTKTYPGKDYLMDTRLNHINRTYQHSIVKILTKNRIGVSNNSISLEIFPKSDGPESSELIVEYRRNNGCREYLATVLVNPSNHKLFNQIIHTITWCKWEKGYCKKPMYWLANVVAAREIILPVQGCNETYKFGLITKGYHKSAGKMVWTGINTVTCQYEYNTVPKEPLPNIQLSTVMLPNTLTVEWKPYPCLEPTGFIQNYSLTYCEAQPPQTNDTCDCVRKRKEVVISNKEISHTIDGLASNIDVCVWVSANTMAGRGPKNKHVLFYTVKSGEANNSPIVIAFSVGGLCLVGILILVAVKCKARYESWLDKNRRIIDPEINMDDLVERETLQKPEIPQYPTDDIKDTEKISFFDSETSDLDESFIDEDTESLHGYADPKDIACNSGDSVNSQLSQFNGKIVIKGQEVEVQVEEKKCDSMDDLTRDDYICHDQWQQHWRNNNTDEIIKGHTGLGISGTKDNKNDGILTQEMTQLSFNVNGDEDESTSNIESYPNSVVDDDDDSNGETDIEPNPNIGLFEPTTYGVGVNGSGPVAEYVKAHAKKKKNHNITQGKTVSETDEKSLFNERNIANPVLNEDTNMNSVSQHYDNVKDVEVNQEQTHLSEEVEVAESVDNTEPDQYFAENGESARYGEANVDIYPKTDLGYRDTTYIEPGIIDTFKDYSSQVKKFSEMPEDGPKDCQVTIKSKSTMCEEIGNSFGSVTGYVQAHEHMNYQNNTPKTITEENADNVTTGCETDDKSLCAERNIAIHVLQVDNNKNFIAQHKDIITDERQQGTSTVSNNVKDEDTISIVELHLN